MVISPFVVSSPVLLKLKKKKKKVCYASTSWTQHVTIPLSISSALCCVWNFPQDIGCQDPPLWPSLHLNLFIEAWLISGNTRSHLHLFYWWVSLWQPQMACPRQWLSHCLSMSCTNVSSDLTRGDLSGRYHLQWKMSLTSKTRVKLLKCKIKRNITVHPVYCIPTIEHRGAANLHEECECT